MHCPKAHTFRVIIRLDYYNPLQNFFGNDISLLLFRYTLDLVKFYIERYKIFETVLLRMVVGCRRMRQSM